MVLDNARDAEQVRPLLPGSFGCVVVVTSRNQMSGLVAAEGAHPLTVDLLTVGEARQLLVRRLGTGRVAAEPEAVDEIITRCARLPLALAVVAARAACHPTVPLEMLASRLRAGQSAGQSGLDGLASEDAITDVRAVFSWSYHTLGAEAARLFRLLGLHPGPDIGIPAAASLAGLPPERVRLLLDELARAHLVTEHVPGRFASHDLLRAYATELAHTVDGDDERHAALRRTLDHYLHTAHATARLLNPHRDPIIVVPAHPGVTPDDLGDYGQALTWFTIEYPVLLAAVDQAASTRFDTHTWQLARTLHTFFDRRGHWRDWATTENAALCAARRLADRPAQARAHHILARAYTRLGRDDDAHTHYQHALGLFGELDDHIGQAHAHLNLSDMFGRQACYGQALHHTRQALDLYQATGNRAGQANALNGVGWYHAQLGDHRQALTCCQRALTLLQEIGDRGGEATTWDSLGYAQHHLGDHRQAVACYQHALALYQDLGVRHYEAETLTRLGDTHHATGDYDSARTAWQRALGILDELGHPDADAVRVKLDGLDPSAEVTATGE